MKSNTFFRGTTPTLEISMGNRAVTIKLKNLFKQNTLCIS